MTETIRVAHLYGDLMNTYGDVGNILALRYYAKQAGVEVTDKVVSLEEDFKADDYDFIVFGSGQDFEQEIVSKDIQTKKDEINKFIDQNKSMIAICGGFQLLGKYYTDAAGNNLPGIAALDHYTDAMTDNRFIGNTEIKNKQTGEEYHGFENHAGVTWLGPKEKTLGEVLKGDGNNGKDKTEGAIYKNVICTYFHGPILARNGNLTKQMLFTTLENKYPDTDFSKQKAQVIPQSF